MARRSAFEFGFGSGSGSEGEGEVGRPRGVWRRRLGALGLAAALAGGAFAAPGSAWAQSGDPMKDLLTVERREADPNQGVVYGYLIAVMIGGFCLFTLAKSANRAAKG